MSDFKAEMHQIQFQTAPQNLLWSLQRSPGSPAVFKEAYF